MKKESNNILLIVLAIVAALLAAFNAYVALQQVADLATITGYQVLTNVSRGNITLSIPLNIQVEFNPFIIDWANGSIIAGRDQARLVTSNNFDIQVQNGTWINATAAQLGTRFGLVLRNAGNVNVSVNISAGKNRTDFFTPANLSNTEYQWNISTNNSGVSNPAANTCGRAYNFSFYESFTDVVREGNITCRNLSYLPGQNAMRIDILISIPQSVQRRNYTDTLVAVAEAAVPL